MAEFQSRIALGVKDPNQFEYLANLELKDYGFYGDICDYLQKRRDPHILELSSTAHPRDLRKLLTDIISILDQNVIIAADSVCTSIDPVTECFGYLGESIKHNFLISHKERQCYLYEDVQISNLHDWFQGARFKLNAAERAYQKDFFEYIYGYIPEVRIHRENPYARIAYNGQMITVPVVGKECRIIDVEDGKPLEQYSVLSPNTNGTYELNLTQIIDDDFSDICAFADIRKVPQYENQITKVWTQLYWLNLYFHSSRDYRGYRKLVVNNLLPQGIMQEKDLEQFKDADTFIAEGMHLFLEQLQILPHRIRSLASVIAEGNPFDSVVTQEVFPIPLRNKQLLTMKLHYTRAFPSTQFAVSLSSSVHLGYSTDTYEHRIEHQSKPNVTFLFDDLSLPISAIPCESDHFKLLDDAITLDQYRCLKRDSSGYRLVFPEVFPFTAGKVLFPDNPKNQLRAKALFHYLILLQEYASAIDQTRLDVLPDLLRQELLCLGRLFSVSAREQMAKAPHFVESALNQLCLCVDACFRLADSKDIIVKEILGNAKRKKNGGLWKGASQDCKIACSDNPDSGLVNIRLTFINQSENEIKTGAFLTLTGETQYVCAAPSAWLNNIKLSLFEPAETQNRVATDGGILFAGKILNHKLSPEDAIQLEEYSCVQKIEDGFLIACPLGKREICISDKPVIMDLDSLAMVLAEIWNSIIQQGCVFDFRSVLAARSKWRMDHTEPFLISEQPEEQERQGVLRFSTTKSVILFAQMIDQIEEALVCFSKNVPLKKNGQLMLGRTQYQRCEQFAVFPGRTLAIKAINATSERIFIEPNW